MRKVDVVRVSSVFRSRFRKKYTSAAGFTLVELLVVISIISLLSSVVFASVNSARAKARWARMMADFREMSTAAEFLLNNEGFYPCDVPPNQDPGTGGPTSEENRYCIRRGLVQTGLMSVFPRPPCNGWEYDWENWSSLVALPTGNAQSHVVRVTLRGSPVAWPSKYYYCIRDTHGSAEYSCGGRTGDHSYTLGGTVVNGVGGGLLSCS